MRAALASITLSLTAGTLAATSLLACGSGGGSGGSGGTSSASSASSTSSTASATSSGGGAGGAGTGGAGTGGAGTTSSSGATGSGGAGTGGAMGCGIYAGKSFFNCSPDGTGRGKCASDTLVYETCERGCLIEPAGQDDVCMGTTNTWSCTGSYGKTKVEDGDYYATEFGCWIDKNGNAHSDPGDNCIPYCIDQAQDDGLCAGLDGPSCEETVNWYAADGARFGCLARLRVTNPQNGKAVIVVALDYGPGCSVEKSVQKAIIDLSGAANEYLFGGPQGAVDKTLVHVVEVSKSTPLGPVN